MSAILATPVIPPSITMDLEFDQYSEWLEWAMCARRSESDLMDDIVDEAAERHLYIPSKQAAIPSSNLSPGDEEMVMRVVQFFSNIHANTAMRQLGIYEGLHNQPYMANFPELQQHQQQHAQCHDSFTSSTAAEDFSFPELGLSPSLIAEQEELWKRAKQQQNQATPIIPEWLHHAARQDGRRIRVVTVDHSTETKCVTCIGCQKQMLAAKDVAIVFCPECGCTFAPDMLQS